MAHTKVTKTYSQNTGVANTFSYSGSFDVFKGTEVVVTLDAVALTFTSSTINESASPREYTVDTAAKTIHIGGANLSSGSIVIRPETDMGAPTPRATYTPGASVTSEDLNNNQTQLLRKAMEYDEQKLSSTGGTMTGDLTMGEDTKIIFEGATADAHETTLTVADPDADRTITLPNVTGTVVTTGDTGSVARAMIAADAIDGTKIADDSINSEHYAADSIDAEHYAPGSVDETALGSNSVTSAKIADGEIVNADISASAAIAHSKLAAIPDGQILVGSGSTVPTAVAMSGDATIANSGAVTIANDAVEIGMIGCEQTTISDSDSHIPTSGAVVDYVTSRIENIGGLEVIADDESFPNSDYPAGVVISITDAAGLQVNSSGVSTNGDTLDNSTVTINGFPTELRGGVGGNADPYVFGSGAGLMVVSTGSSNTYNYHQAMIREADFVQLSDDINDFNSRYRVAADASGVRTGQCSTDGSGSGSFPCDGDMAWFKGASKMYVFDPISDFNAASNTDKDACWKEVSSVGDYKILGIKNHDQAHDGAGPTFNGSNEEFDLFDGSADASITSAQQLIVVLNGVIQKPNASWAADGEGYALNDTHGIKFCDPPPSNSTLFVTLIGQATSAVTPADDSVTSAKIANGAIVNVDINASADIAGSKLADDSIAEAKLDIHAAPSGTNKFLGYTSNGMEWAVPPDTTLTLVDEDNMSSNSATSVPSQQSVKAYADTFLPLAGGTVTGALVLQDSVGATITTATSGANLTLDFGASVHHQVTFGHNITFADPSNEVVGQSGSIILIQPGSGGPYTADFSDAAWRFVGGTAPTLSTAANAVDRIDYLVVAAGNIHCVASLDIK